MREVAEEIGARVPAVAHAVVQSDLRGNVPIDIAVFYRAQDLRDGLV